MSPSAASSLRDSRPIATLLLAISLAACGGGGGGDGGGGGGGGGGGSGVNGSLAGTMYFDSAQQYVAFDLKTGASTTIYGSSGDGTTPSVDASEFVNIQDTPNKTTTYNTQDVVIFKRDGTVTTRLTYDDADTSGTGYPSPLTGYPKLSPNGTLIAESYGNGEATIVFDRNGSTVASLSGVASYSWTPDNRLAVIKGEAIYLTNASLQLGSTPVKSFSGMAPSNVAVSPDGTRVAVTLSSGGGSLDYHVWVMNIDGSGLHQVTTSDLGEGRAGWSPDSTKVAVIKGNASGGGVSTGGTCPELWVVPADASSAALSSSPTGGAQSIAQVDSGTQRPTTCVFSLPYWLN